MVEEGRIEVLKARFPTPEEKATEAAKEEKRKTSPTSPDAYLRQAIATAVNVSKQELDDIFILIGDAKPDDVYSIAKFACTLDKVKEYWEVIRLIYVTWLDNKWDKKLFPKFSRKSTVDEKLAAMNRLIEANAIGRRNRARR